ncbi:hypothetical protein KEJ21_04020 [Candidatus Bathyarchaeota archaeon]|nr:hypothetical protein [Candidatus Bathyarchaeota archaeon]MBS7631130.1 hypothetical protein [Candidatus Bathyarchaeota archaeon]
MDKISKILEGAIDIHQHTSPSIFPRIMDGIGAALDAKKARIRGIVLKDHHIPTTDRAYLAHETVPEVEVFGGVVLNYAVGGLNPYAVDAAIRLGAKIVWMPSIDAMSHKRHFGEVGGFGRRLGYEKSFFYDKSEGIEILDERGPDPRLIMILRLIAEADIALATSHLSFEESKLLVEQAVRSNVKKVVATHVDFITASLSLEEKKWMAERGVFLELCYSTLLPPWKHKTIEEMVESINTIGAKHFIVSSDLGQLQNPPPSVGLRSFIEMLLKHGIGEEEIRMMIKYNPEKLLGLKEL